MALNFQNILFHFVFLKICLCFLSIDLDGDNEKPDLDEEGLASSLYRTEQNLRCALKPLYTILFERLNAHPGGLKFLVDLRADISAAIK